MIGNKKKFRERNYECNRSFVDFSRQWPFLSAPVPGDETLTVVGIFIALRDFEQETDWLSCKLVRTCIPLPTNEKHNFHLINGSAQRLESTTFFSHDGICCNFSMMQATIWCSGARGTRETYRHRYKAVVVHLQNENTSGCCCCCCISHHIRQRLGNRWKDDAAFTRDAQWNVRNENTQRLQVANREVNARAELKVRNRNKIRRTAAAMAAQRSLLLLVKRRINKCDLWMCHPIHFIRWRFSAFVVVLTEKNNNNDNLVAAQIIIGVGASTEFAIDCDFQ